MSRTIVFDPFAVALGISFVPIDRKSKRAYHPDWTNPDKLFPIDNFKPDDNHGARWGVASGGLMDIDCDTVFASRVCEHVIRKGPRCGRPSNRASHYTFAPPARRRGN
jgi:hypothetical protein